MVFLLKDTWGWIPQWKTVHLLLMKNCPIFLKICSCNLSWYVNNCNLQETKPFFCNILWHAFQLLLCFLQACQLHKRHWMKLQKCRALWLLERTSFLQQWEPNVRGSLQMWIVSNPQMQHIHFYFWRLITTRSTQLSFKIVFYSTQKVEHSQQQT